MYCNKCGKELTPDSSYCCYCGAKVVPQVSKDVERFLETWLSSSDSKSIESEFSSSNNLESSHLMEAYSNAAKESVKKSKTASKKKRLPLYIVIGVIVIGLCILLLRTPVNTSPTKNTSNSNGSTTSSDYDSNFETPTPVAEPGSGTILSGSEGYESEITITTDSMPYVVKLKDAYGKTVVSFFVRAHDTVTVGLPAEYMYVYFACGENWYGRSEMFGENTYYSKDDTGVDFSQYTMTYTLYPVTNGNFQETTVDESEFK